MQFLYQLIAITLHAKKQKKNNNNNKKIIPFSSSEITQSVSRWRYDTILKKIDQEIPRNEIGFSLSINNVIYRFHRAPDVHRHRVKMAVNALPCVE